MFSGIVEEVGRITRYNASSGELVVEASRVLSGEDGLRVSESVSVSGACLTVTGVTPGNFHVEITPETRRSTWFSDLTVGMNLNLERALKYNSRVGGHLVQGHVDGIGRVQNVVQDGGAKLLTIGCTENVSRYIVEKGFVAVDGVSLTTFDCTPTSFTFTLIPFTAIHTTLGVVKPSDAVNIETDLTGKYIERFVTQPISPCESGASKRSPNDQHQSGVCPNNTTLR